MKFTDQQLAKHLLQRKELEGKRPPFTTRQKIGYAVWGVMLLIAIILQNMYPNNPVSWFLFGVVLAVTVRDFAWYKTIRLTWPFSEKVTDWDKVKELAEDNNSDKTA